MNTRQKGFSLIELMMVVAIIGILAAIAIPQYKDYVTKSKWSANLTDLDAFKNVIFLCIQDGGDGTACDTAAELGIPALLTPQYATAAVTLTGAANSVTISFTGKADAGGYVYAANCLEDASRTSIVCTKTASDTIPLKIINTSAR